ncbi:hypothetical protein MHPYR_110027 [uncultured Mycobacterium sp.]|uniref:FAD/NAD(P)-binding domain-containing protein n=1 Tax=uncultured Mycobacterium sp. TaxID=171292 RepID=A0A1Y5P5Y4_9MYCO|nr:hypothetical protein MHPYR_110027 [uncultured Mycobacterium sp.]
MQHFDIAIIGTGSGNSIIDERYAGKKIAICEQGVFGGTCLNVGCIPTKMFVYAAEVAQTVRESARYGVDAHIDGVRWNDIVSRVFGRIDPLASGGEHYRRSLPNVTVFDSHTRFTGRTETGYRLRTEKGEEFTAEQVVIAAGARAMIPEAIAGCGVQVHTSDTIMRIPELPKHLVIIGGGFVAAEFAHVFSALGTRVTIVIRGGGMLSHCDDTICERFTDIASKKWEIRSHRNMIGAHHEGAQVVIELDDDSSVADAGHRRIGGRAARRRGAGGDGPDPQRRSDGPGSGRRGRRRRWPGRGRRIPTDHGARRFRARRRVIQISAQARRQPRGPGGAAQPAPGLG